MKLFVALLTAICVFSHTAALSQQQDTLKDDGVTSPVHRQHPGRIMFMAKAIPAAEVKQSDYLETFTLRDSVDFNIWVYLAKSLSNYLHDLAPEIPFKQLGGQGNFQFSFSIDDKLIYEENLHVNAGTADTKDKGTMFRVPLISTTNEDSWGRFLWNRFMMRGGEDALPTGSHVMIIEVRPYIKTDKVRVGDIIAKGEIKMLVPEIHVPEEAIRLQKIKKLKDWVISKESFDSGAIRGLNRKIAEKRFKDITSIVVVKDGKLLIEEYFGGAKRETLHDTRSVGKTFTSALMGIAIKDKSILSENQTLKDFYDLSWYANYHPAKQDVSIRHLLTMSSVFNGSDDDSESPGNEEKMYPSGNWVKFALDLPIDSSKQNGGQWSYFTAGVVLLGDILDKKVPGGLEKYAARKLFGPLTINRYSWEYTPQHVVNTAGGLQLRSIDLAKFGQLYLNKGSWKGKQIISRDWVKKSLSKVIQLPWNEQEGYGYLFWNQRFSVAGKDREAFYLSGNGGNKVFIFPQEKLVIVITSTAYNKPYGHTQVAKMIEKLILPAITGK